MDMSGHIYLTQLMADNIKDYAIILLDIDGKVLSWNAGAKKLLGYEAAQGGRAALRQHHPTRLP